MFSRLDSLFLSQIRHAETLDTRQGIRREEQTGRQGGNRRDPEPQEKQAWEDETTLSLRALQTFLEQLLTDAQKTPNAPQPAPAVSAATAALATAPPPVPPPSTHAANAYARTYRATHDDAPMPAPPGAVPVLALRTDEIRAIHALLTDVKALLGRGLSTLPLRKSDSFLQSLVDAVAALKREHGF